MNASAELNFAGRLVQRLGPHSQLVEAATGQTISAGEIRGLIQGTAAGLLAGGLRAGDRVLLRCGLNPASALAYLGAMYAGLVPVPLEERAFQAAGQAVGLKTRAQAVWTSSWCP